jgi:putative transposase
VAEEYSTTVSFIGEEKTSSKCPMHEDGCGKRIKRGLFKCKRLKKVFNADLVAAYNILITPSSERDRGNWPETRPGIESQTGDVIPNFSTPAATFAI